MDIIAIIVPICAVLALIVAYALASWIGKLDEGTDRMKEISGYIREGAMAFLKREYKYMAVVIVVVFLVLGVFINWITAGLYVFGAIFSVLAGYFGMTVATNGNVRTANAARTGSMPKALKVAFRSGAVMGLCVVGLGTLGLGIIFVVMGVDSADV
ncbi:MAG: sodium/proton-translocating pyrophosphatase, partial [Anaerovoracaceae bacterium]